MIPVYQQVANGLVHLVKEGVLKPGFMLPPSRTLADLMQLNRTTIVSAYEELRVQDWIEVIPRKGIFIATNLPMLKPRTFKTVPEIKNTEAVKPDYFLKLTDIDYQQKERKSYNLVVNDGFPDARVAPLTVLLNKYKSLLGKSYMDGLFMDGDPSGSKYLREELASFLSKTRAIDTSSANILVTRGAQVAIYIAARMLLKPGSVVIVGEPNYILANRVFEQFGARLIKVKVDEFGIDVEEIEKICAKKKPDLLYIIPHHHHPTTVTLSAERRVKLLNLIRNYQLPVIEDDYDYDFHYDNSPILPLASANHEGNVLYIGSITKTLAASVRVGYLVAGKEFIWQASKLKQLMEIRGDVLMEESLASLYSSGEMQKHITRSVRLYRERRDMFCNLLDQELGEMVKFKRPLGGMAVWTTFDQKYQLPELSKKIGAQGIYINDGSLYLSGNMPLNSLRIGFAAMTESEMKNLVHNLKLLK